MEWLNLYVTRALGRILFSGNCYDSITSNIVTSLLDQILTMIEQIQYQMMDWFEKYQQKDIDIEGTLVSSAATMIKKILNKHAQRYKVIPSDNSMFDVFSTETMSTYVVCLNNNICQCYEQQRLSLPSQLH